ncbi:MAG: LapA family protein [Alphaproteobacteria bacterium]
MREGNSMHDVLRAVLIVVLLGLLVIFVIQNVATAEVNFLFWSMSLPRAVLYFIMFVLGGLAGWLIRYFGSRTEDGEL